MGGVRGIARVAAALLVIAAAVPATADARLKRCDPRLRGALRDRRRCRSTAAAGCPAASTCTSSRCRSRATFRREAQPGGAPSRRTAEHGAIFALAGGPGQPATQFTSDFVFAFGDQANGRDVVTFDQRGTGRSGLLRCPEIEQVTLLSRYPEAGREVRGAPGRPPRPLHDERLGRRHGGRPPGDRRRQDRDLRRVLRHQGRAGLRGALPRARRAADPRLGRHARGPDPLYRDTFAATPRVARASCGSECDFTADAGEDLSVFAGQLAAGPARGAGRRPQRAARGPSR